MKIGANAVIYSADHGEADFVEYLVSFLGADIVNYRTTVSGYGHEVFSQYISV